MTRLLELFKGTGSVGQVFKENNWEVISLDFDPKCEPTICVDILQWDYLEYDPDSFDFIWASPDCTQYSRARTTAKTPRNLARADSIVSRTLEIIKYFGCHYIIENPQSGLLKDRNVISKIPYVDTSFCKYGTPYRKNTRLWTDLGDYLLLHPMCSREFPCEHLKTGRRRHPKSAQRGAGRRGGARVPGDICSLDELHTIPRNLVMEVLQCIDFVLYLESMRDDVEGSKIYDAAAERQVQEAIV